MITLHWRKTKLHSYMVKETTIRSSSKQPNRTDGDQSMGTTVTKSTTKKIGLKQMGCQLPMSQPNIKSASIDPKSLHRRNDNVYGH